MGLMAVLKNFTREFAGGVHHTDATVDPGGQPLKNCEHFAPAGDDAHPLNNDFVATVGIPRSGGQVAVGYVDPNNPAKTQPGGKRIYSRSEAAEIQGEVWLKNDATNILQNANIILTQSPDGTYTVDNGGVAMVWTPDGNVTVTTQGAVNVSAASSVDITSAANVTIGAGSDLDMAAQGDMNIQSEGTIRINGVEFAPGGVVTQMTALTLNGKQIDGHVHGGVDTGPSNTGPNV